MMWLFTSGSEVIIMSKTNVIPKERKRFYNWLCENLNIRIANLWLDEKWDDFIEAVKEGAE